MRLSKIQRQGKKGPAEGHGLGLAIAKEFSERFGAQFKLISIAQGFSVKSEFDDTI